MLVGKRKKYKTIKNKLQIWLRYFAESIDKDEAIYWLKYIRGYCNGTIKELEEKKGNKI